MPFWKWFGKKMDTNFGFAFSMMLLGTAMFIVALGLLTHYPWLFYVIVIGGIAYVLRMYQKENK